jgi:uncharacterized OB-fold protein
MGDGERLKLSDQPYLASSQDGEPQLLAGECEDCGKHVFPPPAVCPFCMGERIRTVPISRRGKLYSYSYLPQGLPLFDSSYYVAFIDMPEGVRIFAQLADVDPGSLACDMAVELRASEPKTDRFGRAVGRFKFVPVRGT